MGRKVTKTALTEAIRELSGLAVKDSRTLADELLASYEITAIDDGVPPRPVMKGPLWLHRASRRRLGVSDTQTAPMKISEAITSWETTHVSWYDADDPNSFGVVTIDQWRSECRFIELAETVAESDGFASLMAMHVSSDESDVTLSAN